MHSSATLQDLQEALTPEYVRILQIIHVAIASSAVVLLLVVVFVSGAGGADTAGDANVVLLMSIIHLAFGLSMYGAATHLYQSRFRLAANVQSGTRIAETFLGTLRTASITRLALFEGVAFFGVAVCLVAAQGGVLRTFPEYWLNALSTVVLVGLAATTFPHKERIESLFREKVLETGLRPPPIH